MAEKARNPYVKPIGDLLTDDALAEVSGGTFGPTTHIKQITSKTYNTWIGTSPNQIVFYGASWCGPCHLVNETLEILAGDNLDYEVAVIDVDENPEFWAKGNVKNIPTVVKFKDGFEVARMEGNKSLNEFGTLF